MFTTRGDSTERGNLILHEWASLKNSFCQGRLFSWRRKTRPLFTLSRVFYGKRCQLYGCLSGCRCRGQYLRIISAIFPRFRDGREKPLMDRSQNRMVNLSAHGCTWNFGGGGL